MTVSPLRDPEGKIVGASKVARDVTEHKRIQRQMKDMNLELESRVERRTAELRDAVGEIEGFAYTVAHDLRGPIRAMTGFSEIVLDEEANKLDPESAERLGRIVAAGKRMDAMLQDLLVYSRLSRENLVLEEIDLEALLRDVLHHLEPQTAPRNARIELLGTFPRVRGHRTTLSLIFTNLVENAVKFVRPGVTPEVRLRAEAAPEGMARIWVEDNGIGISPEHHQQIFGVFQRLNDVEAYPGTGIGLAIVKRAAERMGGAVGLESEPGKGSRFHVDLQPAGVANPSRSS